MDVQTAAEAANFASFQMQSSFGDHRSEPGRLQVTQTVPEAERAELTRMGYHVEALPKVYSPVTAVRIDPVTGAFQGAASDTGEDYGIAW